MNPKRDISQLVTTIFLAVLMFVAVMFAFCYAIDKSIENQDQMLCESAQISGNQEYLEKCDKGGY